MKKSPRIIKLDIEEFDLESGVDMISLVESPAIESDFKYFKSQLHESYKKSNYSDEEVLDLLLEDYFDANYIEDLPQDRQDVILEQLLSVGESIESYESQGYTIIEEDEKEEFAISSRPDLSSLEDYGKFKIRYSYQGPLDSKNRTFCSQMRKANLIYRKEDINKLTVTGENEEFGIYDIFTYKGSYGCRHHWQRLRIFKDDNGDKITQTEESEDAATSVNAKPTMNRNPNGEDVAQTSNTVTSNFAEQSKEKQLIAGPLMIPNKLIYRYDDDNGEYHVYFSPDTIEKIAYKYLENGYQKEVNYEHSEEEKLKDITLVESWIVNGSNDKSKELMGEEYPMGTWFGVMKVRNKDIWDNYVKTGLVKGFSVEGFFADYMINASKQKFYYRTTEGGTEIVIDETSLVVFILKDGERQTVMSDGEYKLTNGETLVVVNSKAKEGSFQSTN